MCDDEFEGEDDSVIDAVAKLCYSTIMVRFRWLALPTLNDSCLLPKEDVTDLLLLRLSLFLSTDFAEWLRLAWDVYAFGLLFTVEKRFDYRFRVDATCFRVLFKLSLLALCFEDFFDNFDSDCMLDYCVG